MAFYLFIHFVNLDGNNKNLFWLPVLSVGPCAKDNRCCCCCSAGIAWILWSITVPTTRTVSECQLPNCLCPVPVRTWLYSQAVGSCPRMLALMSPSGPFSTPVSPGTVYFYVTMQSKCTWVVPPAYNQLAAAPSAIINICYAGQQLHIHTHYTTLQSTHTHTYTDMRKGNCIKSVSFKIGTDSLSLNYGSMSNSNGWRSCCGCRCCAPFERPLVLCRDRAWPWPWLWPSSAFSSALHACHNCLARKNSSSQMPINEKPAMMPQMLPIVPGNKRRRRSKCVCVCVCVCKMCYIVEQTHWRSRTRRF